MLCAARARGALCRARETAPQCSGAEQVAGVNPRPGQRWPRERAEIRYERRLKSCRLAGRATSSCVRLRHRPTAFIFTKCKKLTLYRSVKIRLAESFGAAGSCV